MLYQFWLALGLGAIIFTTISFLSTKVIEPIGKLFCMLVGAICWSLFSLGVLSTHVLWDAGILLDYTFMPVNGQEYLALIPGFIGVIMWVLSYYHAVELFAAQPLIEAAKEVDAL